MGNLRSCLEEHAGLSFLPTRKFLVLETWKKLNLLSVEAVLWLMTLTLIP
jgi:hypothetical protein